MLAVKARSRALVSDGAAAENLYREAIDRFGRTRLLADLVSPPGRQERSSTSSPASVMVCAWRELALVVHRGPGSHLSAPADC